MAYDGDEDEDGGDDEEETIDEEPLSQIVERLDATVFGLIEALDPARADLPKLLDEALKGSLWARQIAREDERSPGCTRRCSGRAPISFGRTVRRRRDADISPWASGLRRVSR